MMHIDDAVHTVIHHIVHDLLHTSHPSSIHLSRIPSRKVPVKVVHLNTHVRIPSHWNTDSVEARILEHLDKSLGSHRLSPCRLIVGSLTIRPFLNPHISGRTRVSIKGIAEIPPDTHILNGRSSRLKFLSQHLHRRSHKHRSCEK